MSAQRLAKLLPLAAAAWLLAGSAPALAFSQIGSEDGSTTLKEGIVSVPLPPLAGEGEGTAPPSPSVGRPAPAVPAAEAPAPAATPGPAGADGPAAAPGHGAGPSDPGAIPPDPGSTDSGETETPPGPDPAAAHPAGVGVGSEPPASPTTDRPVPGAPAASGEGEPAQGDTPPAVADPVPPAPILYGDEGLPRPVRDLRERLLAIARSGEIEALRPYIETGEDGTVVTFGETPADPIEYLKTASGDGEGIEMLAILLEVLQAGYVRSEPATDNEIFVWPYFNGVPLDTLTKAQKVELFELVTAGDYAEMRTFGAYNFYRVGISPDGRLQFFVAGD